MTNYIWLIKKIFYIHYAVADPGGGDRGDVSPPPPDYFKPKSL